MITIYEISNMESFLDMTLRCCGEVLLDLPGSGLCDLKSNTNIRNTLKLVGKNGLRQQMKIYLTDCRDVVIFMRHLVG